MTRRWANGALALCAMLSLAATCVKLPTQQETELFAGLTLSTESGTGAAVLEQERLYDPTVAETLAKRGRPAYVRWVDKTRLILAYPERDALVVCTRDPKPPGRVQVIRPIPRLFLSELPDDVEARVLAARRPRRPAPATATRTRSPAPAAPAPSGIVIKGFDAASVVATLSRSMGAAVAGIEGWRRGRLKDGSTVHVARSADAEYRVSSRRVSAAMRLAASETSPPDAARIAIARINDSIFRRNAYDANRQARSLLVRVAADPSGGTVATGRVSGRNVRVQRDARRGLLIYSVEPN